MVKGVKHSNIISRPWTFAGKSTTAGARLPSLNSIGNLYANSRQNEKTLQCLEQTLAIVREIKDRRGEGDALNNMCIAYYNLGQYDKALQGRDLVVHDKDVLQIHVKV